MMAVSEVLGVSINSHYPHTTMILYESTLNVEIYPRSKPANKNIHLFWSRSGNLDNRSGAAYETNHFVPVFIIQKSKKAKLSQSDLDSSQPKLSQPKLSQAKLLFEKLSKRSNLQNNFDQGRRLSFGPNNIVIDSGINPKLELSKQAEKTSIMGDKNVVNPSTRPQNKVMILEDVALFYNRTEDLSDKERYQILCNLWKLPVDFDFPVTVQEKKNRKFVHRWLAEYPWFIYSKSLDGAFCVACLLFGRRIG